MNIAGQEDHVVDFFGGEMVENGCSIFSVAVPAVGIEASDSVREGREDHLLTDDPLKRSPSLRLREKVEKPFCLVLAEDRSRRISRGIMVGGGDLFVASVQTCIEHDEISQRPEAETSKELCRKLSNRHPFVVGANR